MRGKTHGYNSFITCNCWTELKIYDVFMDLKIKLLNAGWSTPGQFYPIKSAENIEKLVVLFFSSAGMEY